MLIHNNFIYSYITHFLREIRYYICMNELFKNETLSTEIRCSLCLILEGL